MFLIAERWKVDSCAEDPRFGEYADTPDAVQFHLHVRIPVGVAKIGEVRPPCCILGISFDNDGIFFQCLSESQRSL